MDPIANVAELIRATDRKSELREALNEWLSRGGFAPRVAIHPANDFWMRGAKYGTVRGATHRGLRVQLEVGGQLLTGTKIIPYADVLEVVS